MTERTIWASIDAFYAERGGKLSGESDFGVHWRGERDFPRFRVSVVHDTGDVYAIEHGGDVELLATVPHDCGYPASVMRGENAEHDSDCAYLNADDLLDGWDEPGRTLAWAREQLHLFAPKVTP